MTKPRIDHLSEATPDELTAAMEQTITDMMRCDSRMQELVAAVQEYEGLKAHFAGLRSIKDAIAKLLDQIPRQ